MWDLGLLIWYKDILNAHLILRALALALGSLSSPYLDRP